MMMIVPVAALTAKAPVAVCGLRSPTRQAIGKTARTEPPPPISPRGESH
jgi:hypothetical protein